VLASRLGAMQEVVREGHTGLLFDPGDAADLASTVERAWSQPERMRSLGERGRKEYETKYTAATNYHQLLEIYQQVLSRQLSSVEEQVLPAPVVPPPAVPEAQFSAATKD